MGHLALLDYLHGWLSRAERKALAAESETQQLGLDQPSGSGIARLVLAAVAVDRHELARAQALLDETAQLPSVTRDPVPAAGHALVAARLLLAQGKARAAVQAADSPVFAAVPSPWASGHEALVASAAHLAEGRPDQAAEALQGVSGDQPACAVEAAALQLAAGRPGAAIDLLDDVRAQNGPGPAVTVRAALVRAQAAQGTGDTATARRLVARALLDARRERLRRPFLDAGEWLPHLLATAPLQELAAGWLTPGPSRRDDQARAESPPEPLVAAALSGREHDVLERLARMMSTQEIAADLYVSENTVKTHLKSVYRKLAVNRRSDAVRRARDLGLV
jgi:LuxR family maltose regulon positive regulatory protein